MSDNLFLFLLGAFVGGLLTLIVVAWQERHHFANHVDDDHAARQWKLLELLLRTQGWHVVTPDLVASLLPSVKHAHDARKEDA